MLKYAMLVYNHFKLHTKSHARYICFFVQVNLSISNILFLKYIARREQVLCATPTNIWAIPEVADIPSREVCIFYSKFWNLHSQA